ncbi:MAG: protein-disulfide reductase DsbD domain-containing protein, partial [Sphingosinicella sp.]|uniref:protein-disulfide reductase DsbD domain-containing protein n=1 Tax=Sphingosinicella sp. TaxID=1917971 RepID=UPI00403812AB
WRLPQGWQAGPLHYPVPDRLLVMGLMNYVYERDYALLVTLRVPETAEPGVSVPVDARLDYLVCTTELCVPETANVSIELRTGASGAPNSAFAGWRQALPRPLAESGRFAVSGGRLRLAIPFPEGAALADPYFFPATTDAVAHSQPQSILRNGANLIVEMGAGPAAGGLAALEGVLEVSPGIGLALTARPGEVPAAGAPVPVSDPVPGSTPPGEGASILLA